MSAYGSGFAANESSMTIFDGSAAAAAKAVVHRVFLWCAIQNQSESNML